MNTPSPQSVLSTFDAWAGDGHADAMEDDHRDIVLQMLDRAGLRPEQHVLDLGCGTGWTVRLLARFLARGRAYGVDVSPAMIERARAEPNPANLAFSVAPAQALPYADASLDCVVSMESIYYWSELDAGLRELRRVLRPGGRLLAAMEYFAENPHSAHWGPRMGIDLHHYSADAWRARLAAAGFTDVQSGILHDRRKPLAPAEFVADPCHPGYDNYLGHKQAGALLIEGTRPGAD